MMAYLHLAHDADDSAKRLADNQGRVPVMEHYVETVVEGEEAYLIDWSRLNTEQRAFLLEHMAEKEGDNRMTPHLCRNGVPIGRSQGTVIEVMGELFSLDEILYAPATPSPWEDWDMDEVVAG
jgi:hypothetical protein